MVQEFYFITRIQCLLFGLLISCSQQNKTSQTADTVSENRDSKISTNPVSDSCVFNNDYKGLTTDLLTELQIKDFIWSEELKKALIAKGQDTVFVSKGGCFHSELMVELKLTNDTHSLTDSTFWMKKALGLAIEYHMEHYEQMITEGKVRKAENGETKVWYEIDDKIEPDNLEYNGIEIMLDGPNKRINISQYYN